MNERIENMARITYFIFNRSFYDETFDKSIALSLQSWFNYGLRSPIETQLMFDIPYISFPIRSIGNWIDKILDPHYAKFMDDIIDGVYGQYKDDDGQYDSWTRFMIANGWIPLGKRMGIRMGNGAFDVQALLNNPSNYIETRYNPLLRGLSKFIETGELKQALSQLATVGAVTRVANAVSPINISYKNGEIQTKPKTIGNALSMFFEYNNDYDYNYMYNGRYSRYTPNKYRQTNNGRWTKYENIYKDLFNKYGKRRKQSSNPYYVVKQIQWQQIIRSMRTRYR